MLKNYPIYADMKQEGLTLVELVIALTMISILIAVGAPKLQNMQKGNRLTSAINQLAADIAYAKSEAINRNASISIVADATNGWNGGWQIELANGTALRVTGPIATNYNLVGTVNAFTYKSDGLKSDTITQTFTLCKTGEAGNYGKRITVNGVGKARMETGIACP